MSEMTVANLLHSRKFVRKTINVPAGMTDMPDGDKPGVIGFPEPPTVTPEQRRSIKAHEYAHIALFERNIIPPSFPTKFMAEGADNRLMNVCLDVAVNSFLGMRCVDLPFGYLDMSAAKFKEYANSLDYKEKACHLIQMYSVVKNSYEAAHRFSRQRRSVDGIDLGSKEYKKRERLFNSRIKVIYEQLDAMDNGKMIQAIKLLTDNTSNDLSYGSRHFSYDSFYKRCKYILEMLKDHEMSVQAGQEFREELKREGEYDDSAEGADWGKLSLKECRLTEDMPRTWKQKHKPQYVGSLRYMHRVMTDMKVWGLKDRGIPPLAVLIDCSGSMEITSEAIMDILKQHPASVIAGYSGTSSEGSVYILGRNGKYANEDDIEKMRLSCGFGNVVDGPALLWLNRQPGRKIWISDGYVTVSMDKRPREAGEFCKKFIEKNGIEYYFSLGDFHENKKCAFVNPY